MQKKKKLSAQRECAQYFCARLFKGNAAYSFQSHWRDSINHKITSFLTGFHNLLSPKA